MKDSYNFKIATYSFSGDLLQGKKTSNAISTRVKAKQKQDLHRVAWGMFWL